MNICTNSYFYLLFVAEEAVTDDEDTDDDDDDDDSEETSLTEVVSRHVTVLTCGCTSIYIFILILLGEGWR